MKYNLKHDYQIYYPRWQILKSYSDWSIATWDGREITEPHKRKIKAPKKLYIGFNSLANCKRSFKAQKGGHKKTFLQHEVRVYAQEPHLKILKKKNIFGTFRISQ